MRQLSPALLLIFLLTPPLNALAQNIQTTVSEPLSSTTTVASFMFNAPLGSTARTILPPEPPSKDKRRKGTYLKLGLAHWQGNIFSQDLTRWQGNIFGSDYNLTSLNMEIESYLAKNHILLSGWSVGYRKDNIRYTDAGHMFSGKLFRAFDLKVFEVKIGGGMEWGSPSLNFEKTNFYYKGDGSIRYRHTYPVKNSNVPGIGTTKDGAHYPFAELSFVERRRMFLAEIGMRINIIRFETDDYEIISDKIKYDFRSKPMMAPYLFFNIGIRM